jgi:hypothetical protein
MFIDPDSLQFIAVYIIAQNSLYVNAFYIIPLAFQHEKKETDVMGDTISDQDRTSTRQLPVSSSDVMGDTASDNQIKTGNGHACYLTTT